MIMLHSKRKIPRGGVNLKFAARIRREKLWRKVIDITRRKNMFNEVTNDNPR